MNHLFGSALPLLYLACPARVRLPKLISDNMVLQREKPIRLRGWATPGEKIRVSLNGNAVRRRAGADSGWRVNLPALAAGGPYKLDIRAPLPSGRTLINLQPGIA